MHLVSVAGSPVISGRLPMPSRGPWTFDGKVDTQALPVGSVLLACEGGLQLTGTVDASRSGLVLDAAHLWIVGGAGGLSKPVAGAFRSAQLGDPVHAIMAASGETLSSTVAPDLLSTALDRWSINCSASAALTSLCGYATATIGQSVTWRVLADGTIWIGVETWPAATLDPLDAIEMIYPALGKTVVAVAVPTIGPGVSVAGVGNVSAVEHWVNPAVGVRTWLFTDAGDSGSATGLFRRNVRAAVGIDPDPDSFPRLDHLALYPARIDAAAANGSTVDVTPLNPAIVPQMGLALRGAPGDVAVCKVGAICRVGWDEGNPSKMYALALVDGGAGVSKRVLNGDTVILGSESGAQYLALANLVKAELDKIVITLGTGTSVSGGAVSFGTPYTSSAVAASKSKGA